MPNCRKLLERARSAPENTRFDDACDLAECAGFELRRGKDGSHRVYKKSGEMQLLNFQNHDGKAKSYQLKQLLTYIDEQGLTFEPDDA